PQGRVARRTGARAPFRPSARAQDITLAQLKTATKNPMTDLPALEQQLLRDIAAAADEAAIESVRVAALGRNGSISALLKTPGSIPPEERKHQGARINAMKEHVSAAISARREELKSAALDARLNTEGVDVTLPVREPAAEVGRIHPVTQVTEELIAIF